MVWEVIDLSASSKNTGLFIRVTGKFNDSLDRITSKSLVASELRSKGYNIDKSVLSRFGILLVSRNMTLLSKNPDLLLAASKIESSEETILKIEKEVLKNWVLQFWKLNYF